MPDLGGFVALSSCEGDFINFSMLPRKIVERIGMLAGQKKYVYMALLWLGFFALVTPVAVAVPSTLYYQGHISADAGSYEGIGLFKFAFVDNQGRSLWSNDATSLAGEEPGVAISLALKRGIFNVSLGNTNLPGMVAIPPAIFTNGFLALRVWFSDGTNHFEKLVPDRELASVAFSFSSDSARFASVAGTALKISDGIVESQNLGPGLSAGLSNITTSILVSSNSLADRLSVSNAAALAAVAVETQLRETSIQSAILGLTTGTNLWLGQNFFTGSIFAPSTGNFIRGDFWGNFTGDGSGINNLQGSKVVGLLGISTIPGLDAELIKRGLLSSDRVPVLDAGKITTGIFSDALISDNIARQATLLSASNQLSSRLVATNGLLISTITTGLQDEKAERILHIDTTVTNILRGTNLWTGTNTFAGQVIATNITNIVAGQFTGTLIGNGVAITNIPSASITGTLVPNNIPSLDSSKITTGILSDNRISDNIARITEITSSSNVLSGRLLATNTLLLATIAAGDQAEKAERILHIDTTVTNILRGTNLWTGTNTFAGQVIATNTSSIVAGQFTGTLIGNGAAITNIPSASITGTLVPNNIPSLDSSKITTGILSDNRISDNIARITEITSSSNVLSGRLLATNTLLLATIAAGDQAENAERILHIDTTVTNILRGTNLWTGTNTFAGQVIATNISNTVAGQFTGTLIGNGAAITNIPSASITGTLVPNNIPFLDSSKITTGILSDSRISDNIARITEITSSSNVLSGRLLATNTLLLASIAAGDQAEKAERILHIDTTVTNILRGTNLWAGTNDFLSQVYARSFFNQINGQFNGFYTGNGAGITNVPSASITGTLVPANIPGLDSSKVVSGILNDSRISDNIARVSQLNSSSNVLSDRLIATNLALQAQVASLTAQLNDVNNGLILVSNKTQTPNQSFALFVSSDPADSDLLSKGYQTFLTIPAPGWTSGSTTNAPSARYGQGAIWTGQEMVVWGGNFNSTTYSSSGARYNNSIDQWQALSPLNAPSARSGHSAVWDGTEMIVWGGFNSSGYFNTGARYVADTGKWFPISAVNAPSGREGHVAIWTGSRMLIFGGEDDSGVLGDSYLYDPVADSWTVLSLANTLSARFTAVSVSTGSRIIIWGGEGASSTLNDGAQLLLSNAGIPTQWVATASLNVPSARSGHTAIWNGGKMVVWGGQLNGSYLNTGGMYDPILDTWTSVTQTDGPTARAFHAAVWSGKEMVIYGGESSLGSQGTSFAFDPTNNKWRSVGNSGGPVSRSGASAFWTGSDVIAFAGKSNGSAVGSLQRLSLQPAWYFYRKP